MDRLPRAPGSCVYSDAWLYITQACRDAGSEGLGFWYADDSFAVGLGAHHHGHWVLVRPIGVPSRSFTLFLRELAADRRRRIYVKKADPQTRKRLRNAAQELGLAFVGSQQFPWDPHAPEDDDTFPEQIVRLRVTSGLREVCGPNARRLRSKLRQVEKSRRELEFVQLKDISIGSVFRMIEEHFGSDTQNATAYQNMLRILATEDDSRFGHFVAVSEARPLAFFAYETMDVQSAGLYAALANRDWPGLAETMHFRVFEALRQQGIRYLNLGGSETERLDRFKRKFSSGVFGFGRRLPMCVIVARDVVRQQVARRRRE